MLQNMKLDLEVVPDGYFRPRRGKKVVDEKEQEEVTEKDSWELEIRDEVIQYACESLPGMKTKPDHQTMSQVITQLAKQEKL